MRRRFLYLLALCIVGALFIASTSLASASSAPAASSKGTSSTSPRLLRPASETSNCDDPNTDVWTQQGLLCAVASNATPCLNIHDPSNWNVIACEAPGTIIALDCQVKIPSRTYLGNSYWDVGILPNGKTGEFSDAYMDTEWTNNTGSPDLSICGGG